MHSNHTTHDLQRLLNSGYSADDLLRLHAPVEVLELALEQHQEKVRQRQRDRDLHSQATYAMRLQRR